MSQPLRRFVTSAAREVSPTLGRMISRMLALPFALGLLASFAACSDDGGGVGAPCNVDSDCASGLVCDEHEGQASCQEPHGHESGEETHHASESGGHESGETGHDSGSTGHDSGSTGHDSGSTGHQHDSGETGQTTGTGTGA